LITSPIKRDYPLDDGLSANASPTAADGARRIVFGR